MRTCWNCKSFIECLDSGQVSVLLDTFSCERYKREDQIPKEEIKVIDGIVYRRIIDEEGDG